ncbi:MAG: aminotransferase class I/II-fold pyridoxal phosphate-dependent enzyme [Candidatus Gastranaerophilales bacterium]|nr:aminotransferase class I/II-fold pyridoxal phosphate-dependent enzyme [Candidatus Gastranaerophilales bacterium]
MITSEENKCVNVKFEDFTTTLEGEDLFQKTYRLNDVLNSGVLTGNEALGMLTMNKVQPDSEIREKDGTIHKVIMLGSNSYLNLSTHPQVMQAAKEALEKFGYGMGAVSNYAGITDIHKELEQRIAKFYDAEDCIVFPSGYGANVGIVSAICGPGDVIINDSANHASIFDGCRLSGADIKIYPHADMKYLERILSKLPEEQTGRLIITDGVFSMDGDMAKLDKIVELANKYNCRVMVDDAHGVGIVGPTGKGTSEHYNVMDKIDLNVGMLSKGPGGLGGYCAGSKELIQYLRLYSRSYFFSTAMPASVAGGLNEVFKLLETDTAGRAELIEKTEYLKSQLIKQGFDIGHSQSAVVPVMIYSEPTLFKMYDELRRNGVYVNIVTYPAVRRKECRLRLCTMKDLTFEQIDKAVEVIAELGKKYGVIK